MDNKDPALASRYKESVARLTEQNKQAIKQVTVDTFQALVVEPSKQHAVLPEPIFREAFLPYFSGQKSINDNKEIVSQWVQVAGAPGAEVDVIDQSGEKLFTVPPVFDSSIIETLKRKLGESINDIYTLYNLHNNNSPVIGEKVLADAFENRMNTMFKPSDTLTNNQKRWDIIFDRYQIKHAGAVETKAVVQNDDIDYE